MACRQRVLHQKPAIVKTRVLSQVLVLVPMLALPRLEVQMPRCPSLWPMVAPPQADQVPMMQGLAARAAVAQVEAEVARPGSFRVCSLLAKPQLLPMLQ